MTSILRYNGVETESQFLENFNNYYHTYQGYSTKNYVFIVPYSLLTFEHSGSTNFSFLDKFEFVYPINMIQGNYIYAVRYNILKFKNGCASLAYI
jgi:hypothetical protein